MDAEHTHTHTHTAVAAAAAHNNISIGSQSGGYNIDYTSASLQLDDLRQGLTGSVVEWSTTVECRSSVVNESIRIKPRKAFPSLLKSLLLHQRRNDIIAKSQDDMSLASHAFALPPKSCCSRIAAVTNSLTHTNDRHSVKLDIGHSRT